MIASFLRIIIVFVLVFIVGYFSEMLLVSNWELTPRFSLLHIYIYHFVFSLTICLSFTLLATHKKVVAQLGFIYLGTTMLKFALFAFVFYGSVLGQTLSKRESFILLIPLFLFVITEVIFIAKILNKNKVKE